MVRTQETMGSDPRITTPKRENRNQRLKRRSKGIER